MKPLLLRKLLLFFLWSLLLMSCSDSQDSSRQKSTKGNKPAQQSTRTGSKSPAVKSPAVRTKPLPIMEQIKKRGELIILTRNAPTTYFYQQDQPAGFEYELMVSFARHLKVKPRFVIVDTVHEILAKLRRGEGHIAAAGLTLTPKRQKAFLAVAGYHQVSEQLVCRVRKKRIRRPRDLPGASIAVIANSSYLDALNRLKNKYPEINWTVTRQDDTEDLLRQVWEKKYDCTVADSNIVAINRRYYPELVVSFNLIRNRKLAWYLPGNAKTLREELHKWYTVPRRQLHLEWLRERYYGHIRYFNYVNTRTFLDRIRDTLPHYRGMFKAAATSFNLDWMLLAAQGYQESQWKPSARSPTGVRGIMMLTLRTAKEMKVRSRLDPEQSIHGGAKYFSRLKQRLPDSIRDPDRTWIALAAYNIGMGHIYDARRLARRMKKDPDKWQALKTVLPLLQRRKYYRTLRYGYARGTEPVRYVTRIRDFHDLLQNHKNNHKPGGNRIENRNAAVIRPPVSP